MSEIKFKISAPGRLVLSGEHTAAYGKYFVSTSIDRRTKLEFYQLPDEEQFIDIDFLDVDLIENISLEKVRKFFDSSDKAQGDPVSIIHFVKALITINGMWSTFKQRFSLKIFFFLFYTIAYAEKLQLKPFHVYVTSDIPIGADLGSSTSFAVCIAACFLHWKRLQDGDRSTDFDVNFKNTIKDYVTLCEKLVQDFECADVDVAVCAHGKMIKSQFINHTETWMEPYDVINLNILLVDTGIRKRKAIRAKQMTKMKKLRKFDFRMTELEKCAIKMENYLNNIRHPTEVNSPSEIYHQKRIWQKLKMSIMQNQYLLNEYKLSNPTIKKICSIANQKGYSGKLTGCRGGFVYILLPVDITNENVNLIRTNLMDNVQNINISFTSINCEGVKIDN